MKLSISIFLVVVCTMCFATQQTQAKKGCKAYGHACYGGHGKRSLRTQGSDAPPEMEINNLQEHPNAIMQFYPSEANMLINGNVDAIPRYKLFKIIRSLIGNSQRSLVDDLEYPVSVEFLNGDNNQAINNNSYK